MRTSPRSPQISETYKATSPKLSWGRRAKNDRFTDTSFIRPEYRKRPLGLATAPVAARGCWKRIPQCYGMPVKARGCAMAEWRDLQTLWQRQPKVVDYQRCLVTTPLIPQLTRLDCLSLV